jgi:hypothetical protein
MQTVTIAEAAQHSGMTAKAIARRVERGTLQAIIKDGKRRLPVSELEKLPRGTTETAPAGEGNNGAAPVDLSPLIARIETLAAENMQLRVLQEQNGTVEEQLRRELVESRGRITELEALATTGRRRWFSRRQS